MARIKDDMGLDCYIDDFLIATHTKKELDLIRGAKFFEHEPLRCGLFEAMFGELSNYRIQMYDYELAKKYRPNYIIFSEDDVMRCQFFKDLPEDWQRYALACIDKYFGDL